MQALYLSTPWPCARRRRCCCCYPDSPGGEHTGEEQKLGQCQPPAGTGWAGTGVGAAAVGAGGGRRAGGGRSDKRQGAQQTARTREPSRSAALRVDSTGIWPAPEPSPLWTCWSRTCAWTKRLARLQMAEATVPAHADPHQEGAKVRTASLQVGSLGERFKCLAVKELRRFARTNLGAGMARAPPGAPWLPS